MQLRTAIYACRNTLDFVASRTGARVVVVKIPFPIDSPQQVVAAVIEQVLPKTQLALLDHVTSQTGLIFPIQDLVKELQQRGVDTLVDGATGMTDVATGITDIARAMTDVATVAASCCSSFLN